MENIHITSKLYDYEVRFAKELTEELSLFPMETTAYVIDRHVAELYAKKLISIQKSHCFLVDAQEDLKTMDTVMEIISFWKALGVRKNWKIVCIGGGITQDLTTMASSLYLRNMDWFFLPTTLLSMCDSCIGGKCGINLGEYKNQLGVFYPPKQIVVDTAFLDTLSDADYLNGWGELLKFSLTENRGMYERLKQETAHIPCPHIADYIRMGLEIKKKVIEADEFESDLRRVLNYGHTFGHALEAYTHHKIPHGKAVIWGIDVVNFFAVKKGLISQGLYLDIKETIHSAFLPAEIVIEEPKKLFNIIRTDKKVKGNVLNFALLDGPSHLVVYPIEMDQSLYELFQHYLEDNHEYYCD